MPAGNDSEVQATKISFHLHTLGWEAFQNLCGHIVREILGQTAAIFSSNNDAGQDGAFQGEWTRKQGETYTGRFVIQCKFTAKKDDNLSLTQLSDEIEKAKSLAAKGLLKTYLLITNAKISGRSDSAIRAMFLSIEGIDFFDILGEEWITQSIIGSKNLRAFVPRVYGLGDLSQILDERAYSQANEILETWKDNLIKFVPTSAHEQSVNAILTKGFVLLLGDPMAGKSTIAAALALAAADSWNCIPIFVRHPCDIKTHWNPKEPRQLFWVDDAFGQIQLESEKTSAWNGIFPLMTAAIRKGAKVIFTSRTHIYKSAIKEIKRSSFPLLIDSQVVIQVEKLSLLEKERILYNHIRLGSQTKNFRTSLKPFLTHIASNPKFFPEVAKRIGDPFFTRKLDLNHDTITRFIEEPKEFLFDVIDQLSRSNFAALALLFMRAGRLNCPLTITSDETEALHLLGATLAQTLESLAALDGSLVNQALEDGERSWKYRHPTVRDAMSMHVASRPELLDIYLAGAKISEILGEVVCGNIEIEGAKVHVPRSRFESVCHKINQFKTTDYLAKYKLLIFLNRRCSDEFLKTWVSQPKTDLNIFFTHISVTYGNLCNLFVRLKRMQALPEKIRLRYLQKVEYQAINYAESSLLDYPDLILPSELDLIIGNICSSLPFKLEDIVYDRESEYEDPDTDPSDHFYDLTQNFKAFQNYFDEEGNEEILSHFSQGLDYIDSATERLNEDRLEKERKEAESRQEQEMADYHQRNMEEKMKRPNIAQGAQSSPSISPIHSKTISYSDRRSIFVSGVCSTV